LGRVGFSGISAAALPWSVENSWSCGIPDAVPGQS
jgi:hypothetical protein